MSGPNGKWLWNKWADTWGSGTGAFDQPYAGPMIRKQDGKWAMYKSHCRTCCCTYDTWPACPNTTNVDSDGQPLANVVNNIPEWVKLTVSGVSLPTGCLNGYGPNAADPAAPYWGGISINGAPDGATGFPNGTYCLGASGGDTPAPSDTGQWLYFEYYARTYCLPLAMWSGTFNDDGSFNLGCVGTPYCNYSLNISWTDIYLDLRIWCRPDGTVDYTHPDGGWRVRTLDPTPGIYNFWLSLFATAGWVPFASTTQPCITDLGTAASDFAQGTLLIEGGDDGTGTQNGNNDISTVDSYYKYGLGSGGTMTATFCGCDVTSDSPDYSACPACPTMGEPARREAVEPVALPEGVDPETYARWGRKPAAAITAAAWPPKGIDLTKPPQAVTTPRYLTPKPCAPCSRAKRK